MMGDEFGEIREAWTELKAIYVEIEELNGAAPEKVTELFGSYAQHGASAQ